MLNVADRLAILSLFAAYAQEYDAGKVGGFVSLLTETNWHATIRDQNLLRSDMANVSGLSCLPSEVLARAKRGPGAPASGPLRSYCLALVLGAGRGCRGVGRGLGLRAKRLLNWSTRALTLTSLSDR